MLKIVITRPRSTSFRLHAVDCAAASHFLLMAKVARARTDRIYPWRIQEKDGLTWYLCVDNNLELLVAVAAERKRSNRVASNDCPEKRIEFSFNNIDWSLLLCALLV